MGYTIDCSKEVVVITGGATGIGEGITELYCQAGAQTVICGRRPADQFNGFLDRMETEYGKRPIYFQCDVSDEAGVQAMMKETAEKFGGIDVLINNAGTNGDWQTTLDVNIKGVCYCTEAAAPYMKQRQGRIVIIGSGTTLYGGRNAAPEYVSTKAGAIALVRLYARKYAKDGIRVNGIFPCVIITEMLGANYGSTEAMVEHYKPQMPLGKVGYPKDIAGVCLFLSSELSAYMDGQILLADGGRMHLS